ncbi:hypothetical protein [Sansalvadorimonas verongulae]|uniref:hypothetical protein n=1 Tax=Sansalvadorimonas verongulae TaxID=2172824 RepID=UPI0012BB78F1|nr:hypothetical protein [Sansalvadorimonas verongulae]MTI14353.1 hypothetical protein [Sansalvadorimonas verongulae]
METRGLIPPPTPADSTVPEPLAGEKESVAQKGKDSSATAVAQAAAVQPKHRFHFENGYCYIPFGEWNKSLLKRKADKCLFFISSMRHALIVPATYGYPHLTIDIAETRFPHALHKTNDKVAIRVSCAHFSASKRGDRFGFYLCGSQLIPDKKLPADIEHTVCRILKQASLPYWLVQEYSPPTEPPAETLPAREETTPPDREEPAFQPPELPPPPADTRVVAHPMAKKPAKKSAKKSAKKPAQKSKRPPQAPATVVPPKSSYDIWGEQLQVDNFLEALDQLDLSVFSEQQLPQVLDYFRHTKAKRTRQTNDYKCKILERVRVIPATLCENLELMVTATEKTGRRQKIYQKASIRKTKKEILATKDVSSPSGGGYDMSQYDAALDSGLHQIRPEHLFPASKIPSPDDQEKYAAYRAAMLLSINNLGVNFYTLRSQEFFGRAYYLARHLIVACRKCAPFIERQVMQFETFMSDLSDHYDRKRKEASVDIITPEDLLKQQESSNKINAINDEAIQTFSSLAQTLGDISTQLPYLTLKTWTLFEKKAAVLLKNIRKFDPANRDDMCLALTYMETLIALLESLEDVPGEKYHSAQTGKPSRAAQAAPRGTSE